jgi:hypothetical protein
MRGGDAPALGSVSSTFDNNMNTEQAKSFFKKLLSEVTLPNGLAATDRFFGLREVDAKVREAKLVLQQIPGLAQALLAEFEKDDNFSANSRRVRLEALAYYCQTAIKFLDSGAISDKKQIFRAPDLSKLTSILPDLQPVIHDRWLEAQKCQHTKCYLSAVILMGSILEALLLARVSMSPKDSYRATSAPRDKEGKNKPFHDWTLNALIDVSVEVGWLKNDRGKFSHALRESRNVVHPWTHVSLKTNFDENTCKLCWNVLNASVDDLLASL